MEQFLGSSEISEFIRTTNDYCTLVENVNNFSKRDFIKKSIETFSMLYFLGIKLPEIEPATEEGSPRFVTQENWEAIDQSVKQKLGEHNEYLEVFREEIMDSDQPIVASLAEDYADIYQDLKDFITAYGMGTEEMMVDALWECKNSYKHRWGQSLVNALRALHSVFFNETLEDNENFSYN